VPIGQSLHGKHMAAFGLRLRGSTAVVAVNVPVIVLQEPQLRLVVGDAAGAIT
jgi:hypothetical protein